MQLPINNKVAYALLRRLCVSIVLYLLLSLTLSGNTQISSIELESAARVQALDSVRTQRLDIAIVPLTHKEDIGLQTKTFCRQEAVCVLPKNHTLCDKKFITAHDLSKEKFITLSRGSPFRAMLDKVFGAEDINNLCVIETRTQKTIYELVKLGVGVAILDPFITNASDTEVVIKKFKPKISWEYAVVQAHSIPSSLIVKAFIELLINDKTSDKTKTRTPII